MCGEAAITGTDASGWGTGQLAWLDGAREEVQLEFTEAERRRPINWRELLGVLRVVETWGERLRGCVVLIEADNTAAVGAATKGTSSSEDMQELVRRLVELSEEYSIELRVCHTPGAMLHRPDQTSRGDPVEEPRLRLSAAAYGELVAQHGQFTEWIGAERRHARGLRQGESGGDRLWVHPSHTTVGSALRLIGERLGEAGDRPTSGLVVVPHDESAGWWRLTRHMALVGRLPAGGRHLEANVLGEWRAVEARREALVFAFPRAEAEAAERRAMALELAVAGVEDEADAKWRAARAAADEAAAARRHVLPATDKSRRRPAPPRVLRDVGEWQRCHYRGTTCIGCGQRFERGERVLAAGCGLVHFGGGCSTRAAARCESASSTAQSGDGGLEDARAYATWAHLEREFALGPAAGRGRLLLSRHSRERFMQFVRWMARSGHRGLLSTVLRASSLYTGRTQLVDMGADSEVVALVHQLMGEPQRKGK